MENLANISVFNSLITNNNQYDSDLARWRASYQQEPRSHQNITYPEDYEMFAQDITNHIDGSIRSDISAILREQNNYGVNKETYRKPKKIEYETDDELKDMVSKALHRFFNTYYLSPDQLNNKSESTTKGGLNRFLSSLLLNIKRNGLNRLSNTYNTDVFYTNLLNLPDKKLVELNPNNKEEKKCIEAIESALEGVDASYLYTLGKGIIPHLTERVSQLLKEKGKAVLKQPTRQIPVEEPVNEIETNEIN